MGQRGEVFTDRLDVGNGRRSYFFNVKQNRNGDYFVNIVESIKRFDKFERQEILVYEEHLEEFKDKVDNILTVMKRLDSERGSEHHNQDRFTTYSQQDETEDE